MSRDLTIAHVLPAFALGGQERVALDLAVGQRRAGCRVMCVALAARVDARMVDDFRAHDIGVHTRPKFPESFGFDLSLTARLAWLFRRERVDVVHSHNPQPLIYAAPAAKLAGAVAVHTRHGENSDAWRRRLLRRTAALCTDRYVAVSQRTARSTLRDGDVAARKLVTVPNGIDLSRFGADAAARAAVRAELGIPEEAWVVGTVGRVAEVKDHPLLVRAMASRLGEGERLVIVGDGPHMAALRAAVEGAGAAGRFVHLAGARRDVPQVLAALDVFALSSREEGLPLALLEAMATGLPVVSTRVGGIADVLGDDRGLLVEAGDAEALGRALGVVAGDRAAARRMGERGRAVALREYSAETMVERYFAVYEAAGARAHR